MRCACTTPLWADQTLSNFALSMRIFVVVCVLPTLSYLYDCNTRIADNLGGKRFCRISNANDSVDQRLAPEWIRFNINQTHFVSFTIIWICRWHAARALWFYGYFTMVDLCISISRNDKLQISMNPQPPTLYHSSLFRTCKCICYSIRR